MPVVRIFADYEWPGFQLADAAARTFDTLPVSDALLQRLSAWSARYEEQCEPTAFEDLQGSSFDFVAFAAEGLELARAVKRELPGWTVLFWDDAIDWFLARDPRHRDRGRAEYEVHLPRVGRP